jgi:hypothetical protein
MYADDTSILNMGQDINELQHITSANLGAVEQYFQMNNLFINPSKMHYILFQTKQCKQECGLKILIKNREITNVKSANSLGVIIGSTLSWEVHTETTCSRISRNLFIINRLSKMLDLNDSLQKSAVRYTAGLKHRESCRESFCGNLPQCKQTTPAGTKK